MGKKPDLCRRAIWNFSPCPYLIDWLNLKTERAGVAGLTRRALCSPVWSRGREFVSATTRRRYLQQGIKIQLHLCIVPKDYLLISATTFNYWFNSSQAGQLCANITCLFLKFRIHDLIVRLLSLKPWLQTWAWTEAEMVFWNSCYHSASAVMWLLRAM